MMLRWAVGRSFFDGGGPLGDVGREDGENFPRTFTHIGHDTVVRWHP